MIDDLPTADEIHDLDLVALADDDLGEAVALDDREIVLNGDPAGVDVQPLEQGNNRQGLIDFEWLAVQGDVHGSFS